MTAGTLALAVLAAFVAHLVKGITGFGSSLVLVPALTFLWGPREAIFTSACLDLVAGLAHGWKVRRLVRPSLVGAVFLPLVAGQWLGTALLVDLSEKPLERAVGTVIALFALEILLRPVRPGRGELHDMAPGDRPLLARAAVAGALGGVLGGLTGAAGPPIILYMRRWFRETFFRAQLIAIFLLGAVSMITMLWVRGVGEPALVGRAVLLLPALVAGAVLGTALSTHLDRVAFSRVVGAVVLLSGLGLALGAR